GKRTDKTRGQGKQAREQTNEGGEEHTEKDRTRQVKCIEKNGKNETEERQKDGGRRERAQGDECRGRGKEKKRKGEKEKKRNK
ncbi:hypothetical protein, partial [Staphylococcus aureus]|uniref:hypothetical protein n=1 Tax=Staphylococcus aureus TaxID=1280 RepID=UPI001BAE898D